MFGQLFGEISAPATLADVMPVVKSWRPDLIINDAAELAAPIAARLIGVRHVTMLLVRCFRTCGCGAAAKR
jgi:hypothetical protein